MALPREPRQKMINIMYLVLTAILALNVSNEVINAFKVVDKSLITSNNNISLSNGNLYKSLEAKLKDPQSIELARIWAPRAMRAKQVSDDMTKYLDSLKLELKKTAGLRMKFNKDTKDSIEDFREDNLDASTRMFETHGEGDRLKVRLDKYKEDMLNIGLPNDSSIRTKFHNNFPVSTDVPPSQEGHKKDFTQTFFHMTPTVAALTMLSKFQNNIKNAETQIVTHCHNQIGQVEVHMDQVGVLVGQNSNYLMPGQELVVTAGVGAYSSSASPRISINGSNVNVTNGQGSYTTSVNGAGEHSISVSVSFLDEKKNLVTKTETVKYVVGTPGGAAVMLDKMNVFYIGVDNPVTISSGTGWDKTNVSMAGGTLSKVATGKYNVRVSAVGKASITVNIEGKPSTYEFRVKNIPPPVLKVGTSAGGRVRSVEFKNQQFARADLENFDFEYRYSIVGATIYFSGANFPSVQTATISGGNLAGISAQLARCIPGTAVTFDNVKVQGPGGPVLSIPGPGFILY
ncbi:MAG: gliding motility protein GldM [Ginsengibacter sp.]